ncbi:MAG TPA: NfeD family protein [Cyclobacteriaceae bacterium]|nr:NfeD family protein [Cyclobacteriaceae bacterium]
MASKQGMRLILFFLLLFTAPAVLSQTTRVMVMEIKENIDPRMKRYVDLAISHANSTEADIVIIEMDTYGGVLTDAKEIVDAIMRFEKPIWVFINADAASAGALISIACDSIYMAPGATIGAATVVESTGQKAPDKYQSYMRSIMRSTAEEKGRDPRIAEGMVDEQLDLDSISPPGQVITFSTTEAIQYGYCEAKVNSIEEILERNGVADYDLYRFNLSRTEKIIAFFLNPFISGILILVIIGGIYFELQTPGVGFPGFAALVALVLYLVPYYLNGLAANWEIIALFVGIALLALEIFVLPGFGIAGIAGISLMVMSMILIMLNNDWFDFGLVPTSSIIYATAATLGGIAGGIALLFVGGSRLTQSRYFQRVALTDTQERAQGYTSSFISEPMKGKVGKAYTVLRPSGKVMIDDQIYDAYTRGDYIDKDTEIIVVNDEGTSLQVRRHTP